MTRDYVYDQGFAEERARLGAMESLWDPTGPVSASRATTRSPIAWPRRSWKSSSAPASGRATAAARFGEDMRVLTPVMMAGIGRRA